MSPLIGISPPHPHTTHTLPPRIKNTIIITEGPRARCGLVGSELPGVPRPKWHPKRDVCGAVVLGSATSYDLTAEKTEYLLSSPSASRPNALKKNNTPDHGSTCTHAWLRYCCWC